MSNQLLVLIIYYWSIKFRKKENKLQTFWNICPKVTFVIMTLRLQLFIKIIFILFVFFIFRDQAMKHFWVLLCYRKDYLVWQHIKINTLTSQISGKSYFTVITNGMWKELKTQYCDWFKMSLSLGYILLLAGVRPNTEDPPSRQRRDQSGAALPGRRPRNATRGSVQAAFLITQHVINMWFL